MFDSTLQVGAFVSPQIRLVRMIGAGGMGSIWIADHVALRTQVVVKFVSSELAGNADVCERFEREAALAAQAKSPHVIQVLDYGKTGTGVPYIAMELLEGEDLGHRIDRDGPVPQDLFAGWLVQACKGLGRAHGKGIIHRDIKPENIFLCDIDGEIVVKILDFGIAKTTGTGPLSVTQSGAVLGTAYFMSPEQTMGTAPVDVRSDLWSLAVTSYLALTGVHPFEGDSICAVITAITTGPIAPPSTHAPQLGPAIDAWMAKALARPSEERFASAKEMAEAFVAAVWRSSISPEALTGPLLAPRPMFSSAPAARSSAPPALVPAPPAVPAALTELEVSAAPPAVPSAPPSIPGPPLAPRFSTGIGLVRERIATPPSLDLPSQGTAPRSRRFLAIAGACVAIGTLGLATVLRGQAAAPGPQPPASEASSAVTPDAGSLGLVASPASPSQAATAIGPETSSIDAGVTAARPPALPARPPVHARGPRTAPAPAPSSAASSKPAAVAASASSPPPNRLKMHLE